MVTENCCWSLVAQAGSRKRLEKPLPLGSRKQSPVHTTARDSSVGRGDIEALQKRY